jgi:integrase
MNHLTEYKSAWDIIMAKTGIVDLRVHDLRRTHGTQMGALGVPVQDIQYQLGHKTLAAAMIYQRSTMERAYDGSNKAVAEMIEKARPAPKPLLSETS